MYTTSIGFGILGKYSVFFANVQGLIIHIILFIDILVTVLTAGHDGFITKIIVELYRLIGVKCSFWLKRWDRLRHYYLSLIGVLSLMTVYALWIFGNCFISSLLISIGAWLGWAAIFFSTFPSVLEAITNQPTDEVGVFYFTGYLISTAGLGDVV